jgi:hypothetical protein
MRELSFLATEQKTGLPVLSVHNSGEEEMRPAIEIPQYPALNMRSDEQLYWAAFRSSVVARRQSASAWPRNIHP